MPSKEDIKSNLNFY